MYFKCPSSDWVDDFVEYCIVEEDSLSDMEEIVEPDFSEYMWMENEEEFDEKEMKRLEEEDIMQECFEAMLEDELEAEMDEWQNTKNAEMNKALSQVVVDENCKVEHSKLNPEAKEFIPQSLLVDVKSS